MSEQFWEKDLKAFLNLEDFNVSKELKKILDFADSLSKQYQSQNKRSLTNPYRKMFDTAFYVGLVMLQMKSGMIPYYDQDKAVEILRDIASIKVFLKGELSEVNAETKESSVNVSGFKEVSDQALLPAEEIARMIAFISFIEENFARIYRLKVRDDNTVKATVVAYG